MELLTEQQIDQLVMNGAATMAAIGPYGNTTGHPPVVKLFTPDGAATWLLSAVYPNAPDIAFGLCDLGPDGAEFGSVSLSELRSIRGRHGLPVERDHGFTATYPLIVYARAAWKAGRIVTDHASLEAAAGKGGAA